jgi:hypothetical protein
MRSGPRSTTVLCIAIAMAACGSKPQSIAFESSGPLTLYSIDPSPVPKLIVRDARGRPLDPKPQIQLSAAPAGVVVVDRNEIVPIRNGHVYLMAKVVGSTLSTSMAIDVKLIVRLDVRCANESCSHGIGETFDMEAVPLTGEVPVTGVDVQWTLSDPKVVEIIKPGRFRAVGAGKTEIIASIATTRVARTIKVYAPADKLTVRCPPERSTDGRCSVILGHSFKVLATASGGGVTIDQPTVKYTSSSEDIATVDSTGEVFGSAVGEAIIRGEIGATSSSLAVSIVPKRTLHPMCLGNGRILARDIPVMAERWNSSYVQRVTMRCDTQKGVECVTSQTRIATPKMAELREIGEECCCKLVESPYYSY